MEEQLKSSIQHHQLILKLRNMFEETFSLCVFLNQFFTSLLMFGLVGFQQTVKENYDQSQLNINAYCICILTELFLYCYLAQQVIHEVNLKRVGVGGCST